MNVNDITNYELQELTRIYASTAIGLLARAELDRRKAEEAKVEPVIVGGYLP